ncbi:hypothetical protein BD779DRAFT_1441837 [Infundibulicybe gibba]|nr:hypothetical protein BD779DRAFT_1441837 [Infundibulicybe gibba]
MSFSPPIRRLSTASSNSRQEELINAFEAEEERIMNVLSRKLEQLREEKISLENTLEAESESHVNRLSRELSALRLAQQQQAGISAGVSISPDVNPGFRSFMSGAGTRGEPSAETMLDAMRKENEQLRNRLVDTEREYIRITRLNEIYREELIEHRRRLGLSVDSLIGLSSDPYSQPTHHRPSAYSSSYSPSTSVFAPSSYTSRPTNGVPIPRPPSQIHRPSNNLSESTTPLSHSPSSSDSPFPFSPVTSTNPASFLSNNTNITSPPSSLSFNSANAVIHGVVSRGLSYPSVPPPSLSSSFGSPSVSTHMPHREHSHSPAESLSRRNSNPRRGSLDWRVADSGSFRSIGHSRGNSRRSSVERGARVAESGTLIPRNRADSQSLPATAEAPDSETTGIATTPGPDMFLTMSYPYGQFPAENYSTPSTPHDQYPQWETVEREQQSQQLEHHSPAQPQSYPIIQLEEPPHVVPSQQPESHDNAPVRLHHVHTRGHKHEGRSDTYGDVEPPQFSINTKRTSTSASPTGQGPSMLARPTRSHQHQVHPYRRPQSATGSVRGRDQHVRFASGPSSGSSMPSPIVPSPTGHGVGFGSAVSSPVIGTDHSTFPQPKPELGRPPHRFIIRTDLHYEPESKVLTAMLELPGVKKSDVRVTLSTCYYNRVKQITVSGRTRPVFPSAQTPEKPGEVTVRERKFGDFTRTFAVASDIKLEDIGATMEDGILTLSIPCGMPADADDEQDVPVR